MSEFFIPVDPVYALQELSHEIIKTAQDSVANGTRKEGAIYIANLIDHYLMMDVLTIEEANYLVSLADVAIDYFIRRSGDVK